MYAYQSYAKSISIPKNEPNMYTLDRGLGIIGCIIPTSSSIGCSMEYLSGLLLPP